MTGLNSVWEFMTLCSCSQSPTSMTVASHVRGTHPERAFLHSMSHFFWYFWWQVLDAAHYVCTPPVLLEMSYHAVKTHLCVTNYETDSLSARLSFIKWNIIWINFPRYCQISFSHKKHPPVTEQNATHSPLLVVFREWFPLFFHSSFVYLVLHTQVSHELSSSPVWAERRAGCRSPSPARERPSCQLSHWAPAGETRQRRDGSQQWVRADQDLH